MIVRVNDREIELDELSREELLALRSEVEVSLGQVKNQLRETKQKVIYDNTYSDPDWYRRAEGAQRALGWTAQRIQEALGAEKQKRAVSYHLSFLEIARRKLDRDTFREISLEAQMLTEDRMAAAALKGRTDDQA